MKIIPPPPWPRASKAMSLQPRRGAERPGLRLHDYPLERLDRPRRRDLPGDTVTGPLHPRARRHRSAGCGQDRRQDRLEAAARSRALARKARLGRFPAKISPALRRHDKFARVNCEGRGMRNLGFLALAGALGASAAPACDTIVTSGEGQSGRSDQRPRLSRRRPGRAGAGRRPLHARRRAERPGHALHRDSLERLGEPRQHDLPGDPGAGAFHPRLRRRRHADPGQGRGAGSAGSCRRPRPARASCCLI